MSLADHLIGDKLSRLTEDLELFIFILIETMMDWC